MSTLSGAAAVNSLLSSNGSSSSTANSKQLGQGDFLKLLLAQIQNQNPLDPINGSDFTAQLAQFSQLETLQQLNTAFTEQMKLQELTQGANLIGRKVTYTKSGSTTPLQGTVGAVNVVDGGVQLQIGADSVPLGQIQSITA